MSLAEVTQAAGSEDTETVFWILRHASANPWRGIACTVPEGKTVLSAAEDGKAGAAEQAAAAAAARAPPPRGDDPAAVAFSLFSPLLRREDEAAAVTERRRRGGGGRRLDTWHDDEGMDRPDQGEGGRGVRSGMRRETGMRKQVSEMSRHRQVKQILPGRTSPPGSSRDGRHPSGRWPGSTPCATRGDLRREA